MSLKRRQRLKELADGALEAKSLSSGLAASICGKGRFMLSPVYASMGKACLQPLIAREYQKSRSDLTPDLIESLSFISFVCDHLPPVHLPTLPFSGKRIVVFTDAMGTKRRRSRLPAVAT